MSSSPVAIKTQGRIEALTGREQIHIAVAQLLPDSSGLHHASAAADSLEKLRSCAKQAAEAGADLIVFPEYFLSGATRKHWEGVRDRGEGEEGGEADGSKEWLAAIKSTAKEAGIDIVAGTVVELSSRDDSSDRHRSSKDNDIPHRLDRATPSSTKQALYNTAYYVSREGTVAHSYTKQNLWHPERATLSSPKPASLSNELRSSTFPIVTRRGLRLRASMAICWDLAWYDSFEQMLTSSAADGNVSDLDRQGQAAGPDVVLVPTCWYASDGGADALRWNRNCEEELLRSLCTTRALETEAVVVMCNVAGPRFTPLGLDMVLDEVRSGRRDELPLIGLGRSLIAAPFKGCVAQVRDEDETLLLQSMDLGILTQAREVYRNRYDIALKLAQSS